MQFATRKKPTSQTLQEILPLVETLLTTLEKENIINDQRLAETLARQWMVRLLPWRKIEMKLTVKGFDRTTIAAMKESIEGDDTMQDEETLARDYARRKKLGVFRQARGNHDAPDARGDSVDHSLADRKQHQKDLAKMARAGFSYGAAQQALKP